MATVEIDGKTFEAENGKMIIEVADKAGIHIPRFCYHPKLSVAANCRMCLVQVENGRKPVPACATPITHGMKVFTRSPEALYSQKAVMEFLLINHPLDCPICDQGGECELQDVSMGFGYDDSNYDESKRAVPDDNLGSLIATEMTRCIHCTRCVRFGEEIAGVRELGAVGRGEQMKISTYVQHSMRSEVSGNIIDLCPVGALTSKPYRFTARPWELSQYDSVAPHDCLGSNVHLHVRNQTLMRVVPRDNEAINEVWLSDRDRFSYLGLNSDSRLMQPRIKRNGIWETVDWPTALEFVAEGLKRIHKEYGPNQIAAFASPSSTLEEMYLLQKWMRDLHIHNVDHRVHQCDFRDQEYFSFFPQSNIKFSELEDQQQILLLGCNVTREVPLASVRIYKAFRNGGKILAMNPVEYDFPFPLSAQFIFSPQDMPLYLSQLLLALLPDVKRLPLAAQKILLGLEPQPELQLIADALMQSQSVIVVGELLQNHPEAALLRSLVDLIQEYSDIKILRLTNGANTPGAYIAGMLPYQAAEGKKIEQPGLDVQASLDAKLKSYILLALDPAYDFANPFGTRQSMLAAEFVVMLSAFADDSMQDYANAILPIAPYAETSGTYVNIDQQWQTVQGAYSPKGEARPAWKIIRVLANLMDCKGFDYTSPEEVLLELRETASPAQPNQSKSWFFPESLPLALDELVRVGEWPLYRTDSIVRHAPALQVCGSSDIACVRIHPKTAERLKINEFATISQADIEITLPVKRDERIAENVVWVPNAMPETSDLGHSFSAITIKSPR